MVTAPAHDAYMNEATRPEDEVSPERAAEMLGVTLPIVFQRMDVGKLPFRLVGERRLIRAADVAELKLAEDRRRAFAAALSADTEDLERRVLFERARLRYEHAAAALATSGGEVDERMLADDEMVVVSSPVMDETNEEYAFRRSLFDENSTDGRKI